MAKELQIADLNLIYQYSEKVFSKKLKRCEAIIYLQNKIRAHRPYSLQMYIDNYRNLRAGKPYGRNMGSQILDYFLNNIVKDFGIDSLNKAIRSVYFHVIMYYNQTGKKQNSDIAIGKKFVEQYNLDFNFNDNIFEKNEIVEQKKDAEYINSVNIILDDNNIEKHYEKKPKKILKQQKSYERDVKIAVRALANADYLCELDRNHKTFIRRTNNKNYTEPHHLIPISAQEKFGDKSLDVENNIVSLCSNCHNKLHYGRDFQDDLFKLYNDRKQLLLNAGIGITFEELLKMYK